MNLREFAFLADENIQPALVKFLQEAAIHVKHVNELSLNGKTDLQLLAYAWNNNMVIITQDTDFGRHVFNDSVKFNGIVYLKPGHINSQFHLVTLQTILQHCPEVNIPFFITAENYISHVKIRVKQL